MSDVSKVVQLKALARKREEHIFLHHLRNLRHLRITLGLYLQNYSLISNQGRASAIFSFHNDVNRVALFGSLRHHDLKNWKIERLVVYLVAYKTCFMVINIPDQALLSAKISSEDLLLDFAVYLYEKQILSIGQARKIVDMDLISFQQELAKRDVFIHFEIQDLEKDLANLEML